LHGLCGRTAGIEAKARKEQQPNKQGVKTQSTQEEFSQNQPA
jgi:hypothetical protein